MSGSNDLARELYWGNPQAQARFSVGQRVSFWDEVRSTDVEATITAIDWNRAAGPLIVETDSAEIMALLPWNVTPVLRTAAEIEAFLSEGDES